jgi:hypothetical protein
MVDMLASEEDTCCEKWKRQKVLLSTCVRLCVYVLSIETDSVRLIALVPLVLLCLLLRILLLKQEYHVLCKTIDRRGQQKITRHQVPSFTVNSTNNIMAKTGVQAKPHILGLNPRV